MVAAKTINITEILINIQITHLYKYKPFIHQELVVHTHRKTHKKNKLK